MSAEKEWREFLLAQDLTTWPPGSAANSEMGRKGAHAQVSALVHIDYAPLVSASLLEHPWLKEFTNYSREFKGTLTTFRHDRDATCWVLREYVIRLWAKLLRSKFDTPEQPFSHARPYDADLLNQRLKESRSYAQFGEAVREETESALYDLINIVRMKCKDVMQDDQWQQLRSNIQIFCQKVGCSPESSSPQAAISKLQESFRDNDTAKELRDRIKEMELELRRQRRIITCLTYRHILEHLPEHFKKEKRMDYANDWANFWSETMRVAGKGQDDEHPFAFLIKQFGAKPGLETVEQVAQDMYGTLSTNIHHFKGKGTYDVRDDQWDILPCAILRAIVPDRKEDGSIDWEKERKRFLQSSVLSGGDECSKNKDEESGEEDDDEKAINKINGSKFFN